MSVRSDKPQDMNGIQNMMMKHSIEDVGATIDAATNAVGGLADANDFTTNDIENPLHRTMAVSIRSSLNDLCLRKNKSVWSPTSAAMKSIMQQQKFTDLTGATELQGDLKSVVLHNLSISAQKSTFPIGKPALN
jgi:hypothetical protein